MNNRQKFSEYMLGLCEIHQRQFSEVLGRVYWQALEPYDDSECEGAFEVVIADCKWFPKPADLLEIIRGSNEDRALLAWDEVWARMKQIGSYRSTRFDDPVIHSCIMAMGGWPAIGRIEADQIGWKQKEFVALYQALRHKAEHPDHVNGLHEKMNDGAEPLKIDCLVTRALPEKIG